MSISALMVHQTRDEGYKIIMRKRSPNVAVDSGAVPGFTFQPEVDEVKEWDVRHCLIKEYCEELFDESGRYQISYPRNPVFGRTGQLLKIWKASR